MNKAWHDKSNPAPLVRARGLSKTFGGQKAVDNIDFDIFPGEIVGFLGPNGAGKTTTIRMLLNLLNPTSGELTLFNHSFTTHRNEILSQMNASSGTLTLPGKLSVRENLRVFADLYGLAHAQKRIDHLMGQFELGHLKNRPLYSLSTGQQVRVSLAKAFLNRPKLLLLDEPTSSLDPDVADRVRSFLIKAVKDEGTTVFLTSHNMMEVSQICTRIVFLKEGRVFDQGTPHELVRKINRSRLTLVTKHPLQELPRTKTVHIQISEDRRHIEAELAREEVGPFLTELVQNGAAVHSVSIHEPTLEDFFVQSARGETVHE